MSTLGTTFSSVVFFITQKKSTITIDCPFDTKNETDIFSKKYPGYDKKYKYEISDCKFEIGNYYHIIYKDAFLNVTKRIVKAKDFFIHIKDFKKFKEDYQELDSWNPEKDLNFVNFKYLENGKIFINLDGETISNNSLPKTVFKDENLEIMLNTNCLLRRGKIQNFKLSQISEVREIIKGETVFEDLIEEDIHELQPR